MPEDRVIRTDFGRETLLDLSSAELEYTTLMYPVSQVSEWDKWQDGFYEYWRGDQHEAIREEFRCFKRQILENFKYYRVPVIALDRSTSKEAVCVVFEKVNTGGKPLDAFELVTAMYAASGHELRKDWYGDDGTRAATAVLQILSGPLEKKPASSPKYPILTSFKRFRFFIPVIGVVRRRMPGNRAKNCRPLQATGRLS